MGKTFNTGYLQNIIQYDGSNNIILPSLIGTGTRIVVAAANGTLSSQTASTTNIAEGTNLYYTDARVATYLSTNTYATQSYVTTAVSNLVDAAPGTLNTLNELAAALGDDPNFATTVATSIGTKQAQLNGTGFVKVSGTTVSYDNSTYLTTASASSTYLPLTGGSLSTTNTSQTLRIVNGGTGYALYVQSNSYFQGDVRFQSASNSILKTVSGLLTPAVAGTDYVIPSALSGYLPLAGGTLTGSLVVPSPFTIKDTNPYIQWQNSSGTRLGYIQHATNLVMAADSGSIVLNTASGTFTLASAGGATFNSSVTIGTIAALTPSVFGYSSSYPTLIIGPTGNLIYKTLAFGVDVSGNPSGAFSGTGNEYVWRNAASFITPNASNNGFNTLLTWNSSGQITIPGATTIGSLTAVSGAFIAPNNVTGTLLIQGGKNDVLNVGEINSRIDFGSNDSSVGETDGIKSGGRISSVTEFSNGAFVGMAFSTYQQGRSPALREAMRIYNDSSVSIYGNLTINNTLSSPGNLIETAGLNVYLRPASGYSVFIDTGNGLTVTGTANIKILTQSPVLHGVKVLNYDLVTTTNIDLPTEFPSMGLSLGNVWAVFGKYVGFDGGGVEAREFVISRNSGGSWASASYGPQSQTNASLQSVVGNGNSITINTDANVYFVVELTVFVR